LMVIITRFLLTLTFTASHFCFLSLFLVGKPLRGDLHLFESEINTRVSKTIVQPNILGFFGYVDKS